MNRWIKALKAWNAEKNPGAWCVPRKGSPEHEEVVAMMGGGGKRSKAMAPKVEAPKAEAPKKKSKIRIVKELPGEREKKTEKVKEFLRKALEKRKSKKAMSQSIKLSKSEAKKLIRGLERAMDVDAGFFEEIEILELTNAELKEALNYTDLKLSLHPKKDYNFNLKEGTLNLVA